MYKLNILDISVTFDVSKLLTSNAANPEQPKNIPDISVTPDVLNLSTDMFVKPLQLPNI